MADGKKRKRMRRRRLVGAKFPKSHRHSAVARILEHSLEMVNALPRPVMDKIAPILGQAQLELEKSLREWMTKHPGDARFSGMRYRSALIQVRQALETLKKVEPAAVEGLRIGARNSGMLATVELEYQLGQMASTFGEINLATIRIDQAALFAKGGVLLKRYPGSARRYHTSIRKAILSEFAVSRLMQETIDELTTRIQERIPMQWLKARKNAERLARTEVMHSYNFFHHEGIKQAREEEPEMLMRWDASFDKRRCLQCASLEGQIVAPDEKFEASWQSTSGKGYSNTTQHPPAHPSCRCVLIPWMAHWPDTEFNAEPTAA